MCSPVRCWSASGSGFSYSSWSHSEWQDLSSAKKEKQQKSFLIQREREYLYMSVGGTACSRTFSSGSNMPSSWQNALANKAEKHSLWEGGIKRTEKKKKNFICPTAFEYSDTHPPTHPCSICQETSSYTQAVHPTAGPTMIKLTQTNQRVSLRRGEVKEDNLGQLSDIKPQELTFYNTMHLVSSWKNWTLK